MYYFSQTLAAFFLAALGLFTLLDLLPLFILILYVGLSLVMFVMYWLDKNAARQDKRRIPENTLHLITLLGGWPGALIGQQRLRHKTKKISFRILLWLTILVNVAVFLLIFCRVVTLPF